MMALRLVDRSDEWEPTPTSAVRPTRRLGNMSRHNQVLTELYRLGKLGKTDAALDLLYDTIDDLLLDHQYAECEKYLREMDPEELPNTVLVGLLTITFAARNFLRERSNAYGRIARKLSQTMSPEQVAATLRGLEGRT